MLLFQNNNTCLAKKSHKSKNFVYASRNLQGSTIADSIHSLGGVGQMQPNTGRLRLRVFTVVFIIFVSLSLC